MNSFREAEKKNGLVPGINLFLIKPQAALCAGGNYGYHKGKS